jgi:hypothetical protein
MCKPRIIIIISYFTGKHTTIGLDPETAPTGQYARTMALRNGRHLALRMKIHSDILNVRQPWSDKSTLSFSFVPNRSEYVIIHTKNPTEEPSEFRVTWVKAVMIAGRVQPKTKLPRTVKYRNIEQKLWTVAIAPGTTEYATQILSGLIPQFMCLSFQTESTYYMF